MELLLIQCKTPADMSGHYPLNCYPSNGEPLVGQPLPREWVVLGLPGVVRGVEYRFRSRVLPGQENSPTPPDSIVYDFFILPGRGICPDMAEVREATGDYQFKHFGAAQVQVRFSAQADQAGRDEAFIEMLTANVTQLGVMNPAELLR